jgi:hypothetical protein
MVDRALEQQCETNVESPATSMRGMDDAEMNHP